MGMEEAMRAFKEMRLSPDNNQEAVAAANAFLNGKPMPHVQAASGKDRGPAPERLRFDFCRRPEDAVTAKDLEPTELVIKDGKFSQVKSLKLSRAEGQSRTTYSCKGWARTTRTGTIS